MTLMELAGKITLDTSEYEAALDEAARLAENLSIQEGFTLNLDNSGFVDNLDDAQEAADDFSGPADQAVSLDTSDFASGITSAETEATSFGETVKGIWEGVKTSLVEAGVVDAVKAVIEVLSECVNLAAQVGDNVDKGSKRLNISAKAYQEWSHALQQSGANINDFQRGISTINKYLGGGKVTKEAAAAFEQLGISATDASGGIKTTEQFLSDTVMALADFKGTSEERGALAEAIFGKNGGKLNALFEEGSGGIEHLIDEASELGLVMSDEEIANAVNYTDAIANMNSAIEGLKTSIATGLLPLLTEAVTSVTKIIAFFNGRSTGGNLSDLFKDTDKGLADDLVTIEGTSAAALELIDKLFSMGEAEKLTAEQQAEWKATAEWLVTNIPTLSGLIDTDTGSIKGNSEELANNVKQWRLWAIEKAKATALQAKTEALAKKTAEWLDKEAEAKQIEADYIEKQAEVRTLLKRDYESMPESEQSRFRQKFGYESEDAMDWSSESPLYGQLENALGNWYPEWGFSTYGSDDLKTAINERSVMSDSIAERLKTATEEAAALKEEVDVAQQELTDYDAAMSEVLQSIIPEANEAEEDVAAVGHALENLPDEKTIKINVLASLPSLLSGDLGGGVAHLAKGSMSIPYDDYPAILHRGEAVLTASQARAYRNGESSGGLSGAALQSLQSAMTAAVTSGMSGVVTPVYLDGKEITSNVSRRLTNQIKASRYRA